MANKYEYMTMRILNGNGELKELRICGDNGWELTAVVIETEWMSPTGYGDKRMVEFKKYYFKRLKQE